MGKSRPLPIPRMPSGPGIGVIYQELALVPEMTVAENIFLGNEPRRALGWTIDWDKGLDAKRNG